MGSHNRRSRLIQAQIDDGLEQADDPEALLQRVLREMESAISAAKAQVISQIAQEKELEGRVGLAQRRVAEWGLKANAAVMAGNDDLAREALRRRHESQSLADLYAQQHQAQVQTIADLKRQLRQLQVSYQATLAHRDRLDSRARLAQAQEQIAAALTRIAVLESSPEFDRAERQLRSREARAAALAESSVDPVEAQFRLLDEAEIEQELQALKSGELDLNVGSPGSGGHSPDDPPLLTTCGTEQEVPELMGWNEGRTS